MKKSSPEFEKEIVDAYLKYGKLEPVRKQFKMSTKRIKSVLFSHGLSVSMRKQPLNVEYFKSIDSEEKAYWLGFIAADGCISKTRYKLAFCVKDSDILYKFKKAIGAGNPVGHRMVFDKRTGKTNEQYNIQITSKEFCNYIKSHGVTEHKSKDFNFPNIEERFYSHFIRGLYDGDGSIHIKVSKVRKYLTCRINLISTLNCITYIKNYFESKLKFTVQNIFSKHEEGIHYLSIQKNVIDFLEWIYMDSTVESRLDRKYEKYKDYKISYESRKPLIVKNNITGDTYEVDNLKKFCEKHNLNYNLLKRNLKNNIICSRGKHAGWFIEP